MVDVVTLSFLKQTLYNNQNNSNVNEIFDGLLRAYNYGLFNEIYYPLTIIFWICGVSTNVFNVVVFTRPQMRNSINYLLTAMAISDICLLSSRAIYVLVHFACLNDIDKTTITNMIAFYGGFFFDGFTAVFSLWVNVAVGVWRYIAITWPLKAKQWCTRKKAQIVITVIATFSTVMAIPYPFVLYGKTFRYRNLPLFLHVQIPSESFKLTVTIPIVYAVIMGLSILISICITLKLIRNLYLNRQNRKLEVAGTNHRTTFMLTVLIANFTLTNGLSIIFYVNYFHALSKLEPYYPLVYFLQDLDKNLIFFIYYFMSSNYKNVFLGLIRSWRIELQCSNQKHKMSGSIFPCHI